MSFNNVLEEDGLHNFFVKVYIDAIRNSMKFASNFASVLQSTELSLWPTAKLSTLHSHKNPHQARASNSTGPSKLLKTSPSPYLGKKLSVLHFCDQIVQGSYKALDNLTKSVSNC